MIRLALASLIFIGTAQAQEDRSWHLLQKQYDGLIRSVQHGLTQHECEFALARIMGLPATDDEKAEAKRRSDLQMAHDKAEREKWQAEHPKCTADQANWSKAPAECRGLFIGTASGSSGMTRMFNMTDISSAECFQ